MSKCQLWEGVLGLCIAQRAAFESLYESHANNGRKIALELIYGFISQLKILFLISSNLCGMINSGPGGIFLQRQFSPLSNLTEFIINSHPFTALPNLPPFPLSFQTPLKPSIKKQLAWTIPKSCAAVGGIIIDVESQYVSYDNLPKHQNLPNYNQR